MNSLVLDTYKVSPKRKHKKLKLKTKLKILAVIYLVASPLIIFYLWHSEYNFRCAYNYQTHGYFVSKSDCDDEYQNWITSIRINQ